MSTTTRLEYHPAANLFPMMPEEEIAELAEDIKRNGQHTAIVLYQGKILDGRNRWEACAIAGVEPRMVTWTGPGSPTEYVLSLNIHRRHLTPSQRSMIAADALPLLEAEARERKRAGQARGAASTKAKAEGLVAILPPSPPVEDDRRKARDEAAKAVNVSPRSVQDAKVVVEAAKEDPAFAPIADEVREGRKSVSEAAKEVKAAKKKKAAPAAVGDGEGETVQQQTRRWLEEAAANARRLRKSLIQLSDDEEAPSQARDLARSALRDFEDVCARLVRGLFKEAS